MLFGQQFSNIVGAMGTVLHQDFNRVAPTLGMLGRNATGIASGNYMQAPLVQQLMHQAQHPPAMTNAGQTGGLTGGPMGRHMSPAQSFVARNPYFM